MIPQLESSANRPISRPRSAATDARAATNRRKIARQSRDRLANIERDAPLSGAPRRKGMKTGHA